MIVIGSYAAMLGGFLPAYRENTVRDIDLICTASEFADLVMLGGFQLREIFPDKYIVVDAPRVLEITLFPDSAVAAMEALCDVQSVALTEYVSIDAYVATPEVIWATLYDRVQGGNQVREKSIKDLEHYQAIVDERCCLTPEHEQLADFYRRRIEAEERRAANN